MGVWVLILYVVLYINELRFDVLGIVIYIINVVHAICESIYVHVGTAVAQWLR